MNKLPVYISDTDFSDYILPHLSDKLNHNRLKFSGWIQVANATSFFEKLIL